MFDGEGVRLIGESKSVLDQVPDRAWVNPGGIIGVDFQNKLWKVTEQAEAIESPEKEYDPQLEPTHFIFGMPMLLVRVERMARLMRHRKEGIVVVSRFSECRIPIRHLQEKRMWERPQS